MKKTLYRDVSEDTYEFFYTSFSAKYKQFVWLIALQKNLKTTYTPQNKHRNCVICALCVSSLGTPHYSTLHIGTGSMAIICAIIYMSTLYGVDKSAYKQQA